MTDHCGDAILIDLRSQALCLKDALASGNDRALLHAFEAVTRARGLSQLAVDAGVARTSLAAMLDEAARPEATALKQVVASLIGRWEAVAQDDSEDFLEKDRLASGET